MYMWGIVKDVQRLSSLTQSDVMTRHASLAAGALSTLSQRQGESTDVTKAFFMFQALRHQDGEVTELTHRYTDELTRIGTELTARAFNGEGLVPRDPGSDAPKDRCWSPKRRPDSTDHMTRASVPARVAPVFLTPHVHVCRGSRQPASVWLLIVHCHWRTPDASALPSESPLEPL